MPAPIAGQSGPLGPIQVIPPGLLGLLQIKELGRLPSNLSDLVAPVIELRDWYLTARRVGEVALFGAIPNIPVINTTGTKPFPNTQVPPGQIWYVEQMTVQVVPAGAEVATDLVRFAPGLSLAIGSNPIVGNDVADNALAARSRDIRAHADRGFWAFPGDQFAVVIFDILTTNNYSANLSLRATPCQI